MNMGDMVARIVIIAALTAAGLGMPLGAEEPVPPAGDEPRLRIAPERWDLGTCEPGAFQQVFEVTNVGGGQLVVDEVRVSNPVRMAASAAPLGTEKGKRYQLTIALNTEKLDSPFAGFAILHSNDKSRPNVKVEVTASPAAPSGRSIVLFHAEKGPDLEGIREAVSKLPPGTAHELLDAGDLANLDRLRQLERAHEVSQGGGYELFYGDEVLLTLDAREVVEALQRIAAGQPITARKVWVHDHGEPPAQDSSTRGELLPPPLAVDLLVDMNCERCATELREGLKALAQYAGRLAITPRSLTHPDIQRVVTERVPAEHRPPIVHCIALVGGGAYVAGDVGQVLASLPSFVQPDSSTELSVGKGDASEAPAPAGASPLGEAPSAHELGDWETWVVVIPVFVLLINCLLILKVSRLVSRIGTQSAPK